MTAAETGLACATSGGRRARRPKGSIAWQEFIQIPGPARDAYLAKRKEYRESHRNEIKQRRKIDQAKRVRKTARRVGGNPNRRIRRCGLSNDQIQDMLRLQDGCCAICRTSFAFVRIEVDHCHKTGKIRELLCTACNSGIAFLKENPKLIRSALRYLEKHS